MSDKPKDAETKAPRKKKYVKAADRLAAARSRADWDDELSLIVVSAFVAHRFAAAGRAVDPDHFTQSAIDFAVGMGWGLHQPIALMCEQIDDLLEADAFGAHVDLAADLYVADVGATRPPAPSAASPAAGPNHRVVRLTASEADQARCILSCQDRLEGVDVGSAVMPWAVTFGNGLTAHVEVTNGEPPYVDAFMVKRQGDALEVVCTLPTGQVLEKTFRFDYDGASYEVTFHAG